NAAGLRRAVLQHAVLVVVVARQEVGHLLHAAARAQTVLIHAAVAEPRSARGTRGIHEHAVTRITEQRTSTRIHKETRGIVARPEVAQVIDALPQDGDPLGFVRHALFREDLNHAAGGFRAI